MMDLTRRAFVGGGLALVPAGAATQTVTAPREQAIPARAFVDSVGICTHPSWRRKLWGNVDWPRAFLETGVMNTRGQVGKGATGKAALADLQKLFAAGVRICATVASDNGAFDLAETSANLDFLANHVGAQNLSGIESANEYNKPGRRPADWASQLREFQKWLHDTVRANPAFDHVPLIGPSIWGRLTGDYGALGSLEPNLDRGCLHYYTGGRRPTRAGRPSSNDEGGGAGEYGLTDAIREARALAPHKPLWITEYGYLTTGTDAMRSAHNVSEQAAAKYLVRGLFDAFGNGVEKTYIYSLIDDVDRPGKHHGLMDGALRPRLSFRAVRNLMALFADRGLSAAPASLDYSVGSAAARIKRRLFRKGDGTFLIAMYQDVDSYDRRTRQDIDVAPLNVAFRLARPASKIEVFAPTMGLAPTQSEADVAAVTVPVADHVTLVQVTMAPQS